jgi:hypothetical protein
VENPKERGHFEDLDVDGKVVIIRVLKVGYNYASLGHLFHDTVQ